MAAYWCVSGVLNVIQYSILAGFAEELGMRNSFWWSSIVSVSIGTALVLHRADDRGVDGMLQSVIRSV